ncbi:hypothetical protein E5170_22195 [Pseudomonas atacamensis]|uniref:Uncharacterized protein n=1 Tax=Pseudomonas atacamensis TaxID=2565368 RepID=A0AAQ2D8L5_9PSED|nr:hypothetical protein E5170_22195 [Pseudomonas atacamensis]
MIVPTLCVGMPQRTLRVRLCRDAERPGLHSHAERGNDRLKRDPCRSCRRLRCFDLAFNCQSAATACTAYSG